MYKSFDKNAARLKRHLRSKVVGTSDCQESLFSVQTPISMLKSSMMSSMSPYALLLPLN